MEPGEAVGSLWFVVTTNHKPPTINRGLVETRGIEPRSAGYQPAALPLSYASVKQLVVGGL